MKSRVIKILRYIIIALALVMFAYGSLKSVHAEPTPAIKSSPVATAFPLQSGQLTAPKNWPEWRAKLDQMNKSATEFVDSAPADFLIAKINLKERDIILVTLFWPELLKAKVPFYAQYASCAELHSQLLKDPSEVKLKLWLACVETSYGRDPAPEIFADLTKWYRKLILKNK